MKGEGRFCVQQAVSHATGMGFLSDQPECVGNVVRNFGISLNDQNWSSKRARSKGMRRFAIAELGSNMISQSEFNSRLRNTWLKDKGYCVGDVGCIPGSCTGDKELSEAAEMATRVLIKMKSPGAWYLRLLKRKKKKVAPSCVVQTNAPIEGRMSWREYGPQTEKTKSCSIK